MRLSSGKLAFGVAQLPLHLDRALHRIDRARELDQQTIAGGTDDTSMELRDLAFRHLGSKLPQLRERARFAISRE